MLFRSVDQLVPEWPIDPATGTFDPETKDYITINRSSIDRNVWSRTNRWFHIDVINASAEYLKQIPIVNQRARAQRPIIEFYPEDDLIEEGVEQLDEKLSAQARLDELSAEYAKTIWDKAIFVVPVNAKGIEYEDEFVAQADTLGEFMPNELAGVVMDSNIQADTMQGTSDVLLESVLSDLQELKQCYEDLVVVSDEEHEIGRAHV